MPDQEDGTRASGEGRAEPQGQSHFQQDGDPRSGVPRITVDRTESSRVSEEVQSNDGRTSSDLEREEFHTPHSPDPTPKSLTNGSGREGSHGNAITNIDGDSRPTTPMDLPPTPPQKSPRHISAGAAEGNQDARTEPITNGHSRSDSRATSRSTADRSRPSMNSMIFVQAAFETIAASKDARKRKQLAESVERAQNAVKESDPELPHPMVIFEPLQLAAASTNVAITTLALDCIGKLISYSYFSIPRSVSIPQDDAEPANSVPLIDRAIETICDCFQGEATPNEVQLQIVKSLLFAVLNDTVVVHGNGLLLAIRQTYNIFLLSKSGPNQELAQGALNQMITTVFERWEARIAVKTRRRNFQDTEVVNGAPSDHDPDQTSVRATVPESPSATEPRNIENGEADTKDHSQNSQKITLQSFENRKDFDDEGIKDSAPTLVTHAITSAPRLNGRSSHDIHASSSAESNRLAEEEDEVYVKDAYLVFRAMCKLSIKMIPADQFSDVRSPGMRSKLLSLHVIHSVLCDHLEAFRSPASTIRSSPGAKPSPFLHAIKQYLCLSLSRNGASTVKKVFDVSCDIFWIMLRDLRVMLKKEVEVFIKEIYLAILDRRNAPSYQRQSIMDLLQKICSDPRLIVELFLNYDCDRTALENVFQRIIEHLSRISAISVSMSPAQWQAYREYSAKNQVQDQKFVTASMPPSLSSTAISTKAQDLPPHFPVEYAQKQQALQTLVDTIRSLVDWLQHGQLYAENGDSSSERLGSESRPTTSPQQREASYEGTQVTTPTQFERAGAVAGNSVADVDDPAELGRIKQQKTALSDAIAAFNFKPKRAIPVLLEKGIISTNSPNDIAQFLLTHNRSLDKAMIGEYLGEGEEHNIAIMYAFVDLLDFAQKRFVDSLRRYLQYFRLPGEAQKIDRFLLKFAQRYVVGNPQAFANADTAYILAYSVIMLNTDLHSIKVKGRRMTRDDFIKNNRGINDNADLEDEYLIAIYEEIQQNEIVLYSERDAVAGSGAVAAGPTSIVSGIGNAFSGDRYKREAFLQASEHMANKTEQLFRSLVRAQRRDVMQTQLSHFIPATSVQHIGPMFEVTWMSFLSGLSGAMLGTHDLDIIKLCMDGLRQSIRISCVFDLRTPRQAFVSALAKFTNLGNLNEMAARHLEALKVLLEVALEDGDMLKESWRDIFTCISQLERLQLMSTGVAESSLPDVNSIRVQHRDSFDNQSRRSVNSLKPKKVRNPSVAANILFKPEVAIESRSTGVVVAVDRIFSTSDRLSGEAIVCFVKALSEVSWQEIQSTGHSDSPRTFCLQKLVEISYYNMKRVRIEWTNIWQVLGEHFNQVGCHSNTNVVYFALDSLRQLSMRFMEIAELPGFAFQKDFLKPFEHIMANSTVVPVKDMVLRCLSQMITARGENIRSGWKTMFGVFTVAAKERYEGLVNAAYDHVTKVYDEQFGMIITQGAFVDLTVCLTAFSKNDRYQRKALSAIELLRSMIRRLLVTPECPLSKSNNSSATAEESQAIGGTSKRSQEEQYWFPILFAFHDVLMTGDDLEVRSRALNFLFDTIIRYGGTFPRDFWDTLWRQLLFPIFMVLKSKSEMSKVLDHEELSVWLSTTMIQALRNMIKLFTHYFDSLEHMLDRFLDLLTLCICQENDTIARIGSNCLQQLILQNVNKFRPNHWVEIVASFMHLFERTTAYQLFSATSSSDSALARTFTPSQPLTPGDTASVLSDLTLTSPLPDDALGKPIEGADRDPSGSSPTEEDSILSPIEHTNGASLQEENRPDSSLPQQPIVVSAARRRYFNKIITKCVLQLLMIETVQELFSNEGVYTQIPSPELLRLMTMLKKSYQFAKRFNEDKELRMRLWREGFMKQPPNLLKQESGSAATYINILLRMYHDDRAERQRSHAEIEAALVPLCADIVAGYVRLDDESQQRNIVAWRSVVVDVLDGYLAFSAEDFRKHVLVFYPLAVELLGRELTGEIRVALQALLRRVGEMHFSMEPLPTPMSPPPSAVSGAGYTSVMSRNP